MDAASTARGFTVAGRLLGRCARSLGLGFGCIGLTLQVLRFLFGGQRLGFLGLGGLLPSLLNRIPLPRVARRHAVHVQAHTPRRVAVLRHRRGRRVRCAVCCKYIIIFISNDTG